MGKNYKRVLLDIDNTLTELQTTMDIMGRVLKRETVTVDAVQSFRLSEAYNATEEEEQAFWENNEMEVCLNATLAKERYARLLEQYIGEDTIVYSVTNRDSRYHLATLKWLKDNGIHYHELHCLGKQSKLEFIQSHNIEAVFEDNPDIFLEVDAHEDLFEVDMYCIDYPYNQGVPCTARIDRESGEVIPTRTTRRTAAATMV